MSIKVVKQNYSERLANILASRDKCELSGGCKEILEDEKAETLLDKLPKTLELEDSVGRFQYCSLNIRPGDKKSWCIMYYCETSPLITFEDDSLLVAACECLKWIYTNELAKS